MLRLANGTSLQALAPNDGERADLAQGTPVHAYLPADALRVLRGAPARSVEAPASGPAGQLVGCRSGPLGRS